MPDIQLDLGALTLAKVRVQNSLDTFGSAGRVGDETAALTGEDRLAGKVRDFAGNWDYNRGKISEQLEFLRDALEAVVDTMNEVDAELERNANDAAPETEGDTDTDTDGG